MSDSACSPSPGPAKKIKYSAKTATMELAKDAAYAGLVAAVKKSVSESASSSSSGPMQKLDTLKAERRLAKKKSAEKTKELRAYTKRVQRLQSRAAKLSDDGLLIEFARRQAAKEAQKKKKTGA